METTYLKKLLLMLYMPGIFYQINGRIFLIMAVLFVSGLVLSYSFVENAVSGVMIDYVPLDWKNEHLSEAAMIVGFLEGISSIMVFAVAYLCDAYLGRFKTVTWTTFLYIMGLVLLGLSTLLASLETKLAVFFMAGVLISIGKAGRTPPLRKFLADQISLEERIIFQKDDDNNRMKFSFRFFSFSCDRVEFKTSVWWHVAMFSGAYASVGMSTLTSSVSVSCLGAVSVMVVAYLVFLSGVCFYNREAPSGIPFSLIYIVFRGAILNFFRMISQFFKNNCDEELLPLSPDSSTAIIIVESSTDPEEGKLSPINQVLMQINMLSKMFPMWATFVVYSLVQTTGSTFFFSQSQKNLTGNTDGGDSLSYLLLIKSFSSSIISLTCRLLISTLQMSEAKQKNAALIRIGAGMVCSLICCIIAYLAEVHNYGLSFQFVLLGLMEGLAEEGLNDFLDYILATTDMDGLPFNDIILSIGKFLSIPWILIFGSFWIGDTVEDSHLDLYYLVLVIMNIPNLCFNLYFCTTLYAKEEDPGKEVELIYIDFQPEILTAQVTD